MTTSILPLVEQYTEHSRDVWDGAKVSSVFMGMDAPSNYNMGLTCLVLETILRG